MNRGNVRKSYKIYLRVVTKEERICMCVRVKYFYDRKSYRTLGRYMSRGIAFSVYIYYIKSDGVKYENSRKSRMVHMYIRDEYCLHECIL